MAKSEIIIIAAMSSNYVIGRRGKLPWSIKPDLVRFRQHTSGHPVIMGRHTWDSLNRKPLVNRFNIIVTNSIPRTMTADINVDILDQPVFTNSLKHAEYLARLYNYIKNENDDVEKIFIIGGAQIYNQMIDYAHRMLLTVVGTNIDDGDAKFPNFSTYNWVLVSQEDHPGSGEPGPSGSSYSFLEYEALEQ